MNFQSWQYAYYVELQRKLRQLQTDEREKAQRTDLLSYQINEISSAALFPDEEDSYGDGHRSGLLDFLAKF